MSGALPADDEDDRPWERRGAVRRDCEPHRAALLAALGGASLVVGGCFGCIPATGFLALPAALLTFDLARRDLMEMRAGRMDPAGEGQTRRAQYRAGVAVLFGGFNILVTVGLLASLFLR
jgi:hypothetical protein